MVKQNIRLILGEIEEDPEFERLTREVIDPAGHRFRQALEVTGIRCLEMSPAPATHAEIRERLEALRSQATGHLARFRPVLDRALAELE